MKNYSKFNTKSSITDVVIKSLLLTLNDYSYLLLTCICLLGQLQMFFIHKLRLKFWSKWWADQSAPVLLFFSKNV